MSKKGGFCCAWHIKAYLPQSYKLAVSLEREALEMCAASRLQWVWWSNCSPQWTAQHITESPGRALVTPSHGAYALADARSQDRARSGVMLFCVQTLALFFPPSVFQLCFSLLPHSYADFDQFICTWLFFPPSLAYQAFWCYLHDHKHSLYLSVCYITVGTVTMAGTHSTF